VEALPHCLRPAGASRLSRAGAGLLPAKRRAGLPDLFSPTHARPAGDGRLGLLTVTSG